MCGLHVKAMIQGATTYATIAAMGIPAINNIRYRMLNRGRKTPNARRQRARATAVNVSVNLRCARSVARACYIAPSIHTKIFDEIIVIAKGV
jgi:hypothetical protein